MCFTSIPKTFYELVTWKYLNLLNLVKWRSKVLVRVLDTSKLETRVIKDQFIDYNNKSKGFQIYWLTKHSVIAKRDVYLNEYEVLLLDNIRIEKKNNSSISSSLVDFFDYNNMSTGPNETTFNK